MNEIRHCKVYVFILSRPDIDIWKMKVGYLLVHKNM